MIGALISGEGRVAILREGDQMWCMRPESPLPQLISPGLLPYLVDNTSCASYHREATLDSIEQLLATACREQRSFHLALISMDPVSSEVTRDLAEDALEEFLEDQHISEFIENRLFSNPLPETARWRDDVSSDAFGVRPRTSSMKRSVVDAQEAIRRVRMAWDALPPDLFPKPETRAAFESILIETGAFRVLAAAADNTAEQFSKGKAQLSILANPRYARFPNSRGILVEWTKMIPSSPQRSVQPIRDEADDEEMLTRRHNLPKVAPHEAFQNVNLQKEAILEQLCKRNFGCVEKFVNDLVRLQLSDNKADLAAKSLCDLAKRAKELGFLPYQLAWSSRARQINSEDPFVHNQFADALLGQGDLLGALEVYETTIHDFPVDVVARSGKAEVLKALGRLPEALEVYETTIHDFPADVFARAGKAEVLKDLGRLPEALAVYEATIQDFPADVVARNGKAEVLKALGRLPEALTVYEATIQDFPADVVVRNGRAEVLKALGRLPEALTVYEATIQDFPADAFARNGRAVLLVLLGRYEEAAAASIPTDQAQTRDEWIWLHIQASVKMKQGRLKEADRLLSIGMQCPWPGVRSRFIASRALLRIKTKQLKEANAMIRSENSLESKVIQIDIYRRMNRIGDAKSVLRGLQGCHFAEVVGISRDLELNMKPGKRTISDDDFLERELALVLAA